MKIEIHNGVDIPKPQSYSDCLELIRSDFYRYLGRRVGNPVKLWLYHFRQSGMGFLFYYRLSQYKGILWPYFRLRLEKYTRKYGIQLPLDAQVGYGLYLGHGISIIINASAVIGSNVNLSQFTTIGSNHGHAATIEDEVYIGPSVCTIEAVRIGRRAVIGAGAVVTKDIAPGSVAVGMPAGQISDTNDYVPANLWKITKDTDIKQ